MASCL